MSLSIWVADNRSLYREALVLIIKHRLGKAEVTEIGSCSELVGKLNAGEFPDLILLDLELDGLHGISGFIRLVKDFPDVPIIVKSTFNEPVVIALAYEKGASGFVTHSATPEYLVTVIKTVASGSIFFPDLSEKNRSVQPEVLLGYTHKVSQLSSRQLDILVRVAEGKLNKEISNEVNLSLFTVKAHMKTILRVLGVVSRTEAAIIARQVGLNEHTLPDFVGEHQGTSSFRFRHKVNRLVY